MPSNEYVRIPEADLRRFDLALLQGLGLSADHAEILADNLIAADMRGVRTHGHVMLPKYCKEISRGSTNVNAQPRIENETPATVHVDGDRAPGAVAGHFTMQAVIRKARANGAATGFTKRSNHFGAAAHFAMMALPHRMIGFAATNAGPTMFPFGGRQRLVGNNPIAFAIPAARERAIVLDMAMSVSANSRVAIAERLGQQVPEGWILDRDGRPSTDPAELAEGAGVSIGGPKGIGLSQVVDLLAGVLAGASFGPAVGRPRARRKLTGTPGIGFTPSTSRPSCRRMRSRRWSIGRLGYFTTPRASKARRASSCRVRSSGSASTIPEPWACRCCRSWSMTSTRKPGKPARPSGSSPGRRLRWRLTPPARRPPRTRLPCASSARALTRRP